ATKVRPLSLAYSANPIRPSPHWCGTQPRKVTMYPLRPSASLFMKVGAVTLRYESCNANESHLTRVVSVPSTTMILHPLGGLRDSPTKMKASGRPSLEGKGMLFSIVRRDRSASPVAALGIVEEVGS